MTIGYFTLILITGNLLFSRTWWHSYVTCDITSMNHFIFLTDASWYTESVHVEQMNKLVILQMKLDYKTC